MKYETIIGLEVHAQLLTDSKIFCGCSTRFGEGPNSNTCPVCLGMPGVLPVLNRKVVELTIKAALAANCQIVRYSQFARKNYFYPDLPKGYQISQYELPIARGGYIELEMEHGQSKKKIDLNRIHMEEDAGKLLHELDGVPADHSYVDFNRTGVPLIEIVSEPHINTPEEACEYLRILRSMLQYLEVCDGNMDQGSFRCDANISLRPEGALVLGTKVEIKNMNSFRNVMRALEYEIGRQSSLLESGEKILQETRLWDVNQGITESMRSKEEAHDYRYFPDPDLVPLIIDDAWIDEIRSTLPELPREKKERFIRDYALPEYDAAILTATRQLADYFEECVRLGPQPKVVSNWIMGDILRNVPDTRDISQFPVTPSHLAEMLLMVDKGTISGKIAKTVFEEMVATGRMPQPIVAEQGLVQVSDEGALEKAIQSVLSAHADQVEQYRQGKEKVFGFLVGQVMKTTKGKANPQVVNELLKKMLAG
ncbi:MAG: Asp-tRNA(Asn)/Glu-tRNA(Gln) amidotransferase subunit GatB [Proteobacteria bacterium]|nr:Asp-tRNA(Asn)/Glu-tRNA(Gln) amidotransferase subunit GatB [Pseudomonadota bacterium]